MLQFTNMHVFCPFRPNPPIGWKGDQPVGVCHKVWNYRAAEPAH